MAVKYWEGKAALYAITYDTGAHSPVAGETLNIVGVEADSCIIQSWSNAGGWAGAGTGTLWVYSCSATFITNVVNGTDLEDSADTLICNCTAAVVDKTGDWQTAGNWGNGEGPAVPLADDEVIFDDRSTQAPTQGMLDSESGAVAQCTFDLLHFKSGWAQGVATAAEPLICAPDRVIIEGTGTYYICCGKTDQTTDADVDMLIVNNKDAIVYIYSNCNVAGAPGNVGKWTIVKLIAVSDFRAKYYTVDANDCGCAITTLYISPTGGQQSKVGAVYIEKDNGDLRNSYETNIYMSNGTVYADSELSSIFMLGGTFYYGTDLGASPETDLNISMLFQWGGTFYWRPDDSDNNATLDTAYFYGGTFDASDTVNNDRAKVINTAYLFPGATMDLANGKGNITIGTVLYNFGGTLITDSGSSIGITYDV